MNYEFRFIITIIKHIIDKYQFCINILTEILKYTQGEKSAAGRTRPASVDYLPSLPLHNKIHLYHVEYCYNIIIILCKTYITI